MNAVDFLDDFTLIDARTSSAPEAFEKMAVVFRRHGLFNGARLFDEIANRKRQGFTAEPGTMRGIETEAVDDIDLAIILRNEAHNRHYFGYLYEPTHSHKADR